MAALSSLHTQLNDLTAYELAAVNSRDSYLLIILVDPQSEIVWTLVLSSNYLSLSLHDMLLNLCRTLLICTCTLNK